MIETDQISATSESLVLYGRPYVSPLRSLAFKEEQADSRQQAEPNTLDTTQYLTSEKIATERVERRDHLRS
jgi:hypothetical protein